MDILNNKILITGGSGFLGSHLINKLLSMGREVYSIDISEPRNPILQNNLNSFYFNKIDLSNKVGLLNLIKDINPDYIFHLAGNLNRERINIDLNVMINDNIDSTANLFYSLKNSDYKKFIYISTSEVYDYEKSFIMNENSVVNPASPYSATKLSSEIFCKTLSNIYHKKFLILRLFNFYGEGQNPYMFIPQLINASLANKDFDMTHGEQTRDFTYIGDVIEGILLTSFSETVFNEIFNIGSGKEIQIKELAIMIREIMGNKINLQFGAIPYKENEIWHMCCDNSKIRNLVGWYPKMSLDEGLKKVIDWYKTNISN